MHLKEWTIPGPAQAVASGSGPARPLPATHIEPNLVASADNHAEDEHAEPPQSPWRSRFGRKIMPSRKVRDMFPQDVGAEEEQESSSSSTVPPSGTEADASSDPSRPPRIRLLLTQVVRTAANAFGLRRMYKRPPHRPPMAHIDLESCYAPTANGAASKKRQRSIGEIIFPFPNLSSWRFAWQYQSGYKKTLDDRDAMQELLTDDRLKFRPEDIQGVKFRKIDELLASGATEETPWANTREGWHKSTVTIGVPDSKKSTQASRREAQATARRLNRHEMEPDIPPEHPIPGQHFSVDDFHHKNICDEIRKTLTSDPAARDFVFDPHHVEHVRPGTDTPESVYGEFYNSQAFMREDIRLQNSPAEPDCSLPRAIVALMFWSDATVVSQFGGRKVWPAYMYYGNQSKYTRARPTAHAAHHIAYFVSVRCFALYWYPRRWLMQW